MIYCVILNTQIFINKFCNTLMNFLEITKLLLLSQALNWINISLIIYKIVKNYLLVLKKNTGKKINNTSIKEKSVLS